MKQRTANLLMLLAGAIWGMGFIAQSTAMQHIGPFTFVGVRFLIAALVFLPFAWLESAKETTSLTLKNYLLISLIGVFFFSSMIFQQIGLLSTSVTNSGFLTGLYVVFTPLLGVALFAQWPHRIIWLGCLLSLTGIWLLSNASLSNLSSGDILTIFSALAISFQVILVGSFVGKFGRPLTLSVLQFGVCALISLTFAFIMEAVSLSAILQAWQQLIYAGVFSGGLAFTLQSIAQRYTTAPKAAILLSSETLFAALFAAIFLHDRLTPIAYLGCFIMLCAMILVDGAPLMAAMVKGRKGKTL